MDGHARFSSAAPASPALRRERPLGPIHGQPGDELRPRQRPDRAGRADPNDVKSHRCRETRSSEPTAGGCGQVDGAPILSPRVPVAPAPVSSRTCIFGAAAAVTATICLWAPAAMAVNASGDTSQHGTVRIKSTKRNQLTGLVIQLWTRCTDHKRRVIWPGFQAPFARPQDAAGTVGDSYDITGRDAATAGRFRQRASFSARLEHKTLAGSASVTQMFLSSGVVCESGRVRFRSHL